MGRARSHDPSRQRSRSAPVKETVRQDVVDGYEYLDVQVSDYVRNMQVKTYKGPGIAVYVPEQTEHLQISVSVKSKNFVARSPYFASGACIGDSWGFADKSKADILVSCIRSNRVKRDAHFVPSGAQLAIDVFLEANQAREGAGASLVLGIHFNS